MALELRSRLQKSVGMEFPNTLAFNYPTLRKLSEFTAEKCTASGIRIDREGERGAGGDDLDGLSDKEVANMLVRELKNDN
jgi:hypothetical protein